MARRKTARSRVEPHFDGATQALGLRVEPRDRTAAPNKPKTRKTATKSTSRKGGRGSSSGSGNGGNRNGRRKTKRSRKSSGQGGFLLRGIRRLIYWGLVLGLWGGIVAAGIVVYYAAYLPPTSEWQVPQRPPNVKIISATGGLIANRGDTGGEAVRLEQLPPYLANAVIAIEDRRFRYHFGVDPIGLARALVTNLTRGGVVQGGSTLTQQLAKNLFLEQDRTIKRKIQELVMSFWLEANFSKDEILEMYLNRVYLGAGAYGVDAASRRYFSKSARSISVAEAATLAGLLKAPSRYSPARNPDLAEERAQVVLAAMNEEGYITDDEAKNAIAFPAKVVRRHTTASENYVADWVMDVLPHYVGSITTDIVVDTTIDMTMQHNAERALREAITENGEKYRVGQGAIVTLDTAGAVKALVGGLDYGKSQFNRAVNAQRQPGSSFKPFVYLAALESGMTPDTVREDRPVNFNGWSPQNYSKNYYGAVTLTQALSMSLNTVAAQLANEVGPKAVARTAKKLGITSQMSNNLSIALGTSEVSPLEIASAYVPFSNGGYGVIPHVVRRITTMDGKLLYSRKGGGLGRVISRQHLSEMNLMMAQTLVTGTGKKAMLQNHRPAGGKTGTSQDFRDGWFIGYTGHLTTAVWLGNDNNSPTKKATGGSLPATIWKTVMDEDHTDFAVADLPGVPQGMMTGARQARPPSPPSNVGTGSKPLLPEPMRRGPLDLLKSLFGG
ncbi:penicillin-binding protein [Roseibium sp. CAU 1637]|uniref:Penicillin-binding protein n=1 Tax=Roseibium limicola TaxID=2816037 RepID=A0A939JA99_9HYPH|nr:transglycosylase domain-containing protein [Roseibium limicola]MBO0347211.1 penicillin-binding protein [Roseibium limicola]